MKLLGKEYNTFGGIKKKNIEKYELDIKQVLSSSVHRSGIASQENIFTIPGSEIIQYKQDNTWLHTSFCQSGKQLQRKRKARQKKNLQKYHTADWNHVRYQLRKLSS